MKTLSKQTTQNFPFGGFRGLLLLLFLLSGTGGLSAAVTVTPLSVDYSTKKVTFKVSWTGTAASNRVWIWVDFCPVSGNSPGTFAKAVISGATATAGSIDAASLNGRGFYVTANPSTVTATLSNAAGQFNWCAYGSDFPPNAIDNSGGGYDLKGTPPFIITTTADTETVNANTYSGGAITAITDATGCPGLLCGKNGESAGLLNCCVPGTTNCNGTCKTIGTYTTNDGACAGTCHTAYVQLRDQCGNVMTAQYATRPDDSCNNSCTSTPNASCLTTYQNYTTAGACTSTKANTCAVYCYGTQFTYYTILTQGEGARSCLCYCCN
ncbi:MAG: hypothetical protein LBU42_01175 [Prevotellaceae bacterium]|jgi:hypothetical protein|nr:hypothetical protein [Prevotellaceae bacterium]